jgi:hypothetical protein
VIQRSHLPAIWGRTRGASATPPQPT